MGNLKTTRRERSAEEKMRLIAPLLVPGLDRKQRLHAMKLIEVCEDVSIRSLRRYITSWEAGGFEALKPRPPWNSGKTNTVENMEEVVAWAIELRKECPERSVKDIIMIMEMEGKIKPGSIRRNTLQDHLMRAGYSAKALRSKKSAKERAARRFQKVRRNELWQSDVKYGPYMPLGENGAMAQVYLCVFIDDCTRYIVAARFYLHQDTAMLEDCLRRGIMQYGKPDALYTDNGSNYKSDWLKRACQRLKIALLHTKPYDPEAKGKVEAFNHRVTSFMAEAALEKYKTLDDINNALAVWIEEYYHKSPHRALGDISPKTAYTMDARPLVFVATEELRDAFLHVEERRVDKTGCFPVGGIQYEAGMRFAGTKVDVAIDPAYTGEVEVLVKDGSRIIARPVTIGPFSGTIQPTNAPDTPAPNGSRMIKGLTRKAARTYQTRVGVVNSYRRTRPQGVTDHV